MAKEKLTCMSIAVAVLFLITLCPLVARSEEASGARATLSVGVYDGELSLLVLVAESQGLYARNGVNVSISGFEAGIIAFARLLAGDLDIAAPAD